MNSRRRSDPTDFAINVEDVVMAGQTEDPQFTELVAAHKAVIAYRLAWGYMLGSNWGSKIKASYKQDSRHSLGIELSLQVKPEYGRDPRWLVNDYGWLWNHARNRFVDPFSPESEIFTYPILLGRDKNPGVPDLFWKVCLALAENSMRIGEESLVIDIGAFKCNGDIQNGCVWAGTEDTQWTWLLGIPRGRVEQHPNAPYRLYKWSDLMRAVERFGSKIPCSPV